MKKLILLCIFIFVISQIIFAQNYGWTDISTNIPTEADLSDVFFVSDDEGWITSSSQAEIYHTTDGGLTFDVQTTLYTCNAIHMLNENTGYAGGHSGFIYKTTDGGMNWDFYGTMVANLTDISFPPVGDTGYCSGINGNIYSISSSGVNKMTSNVNGDLSSLSFPINSSEGWVCGGDIILTYANGIWGGASNGYPSGDYLAIQMIDTLRGWSAGSKLIHTTDGQNWIEQQNPNTQNIMTDVFFLNENKGWIIGNGGLIMHTSDGGENWLIAVAGLTNSLLKGVYFTSATNGYVVGNGKTLIKYTEVSGTKNELVEALQFSMFPNPANNKTEIKSSEFLTEKCTIEICNINGENLIVKQIATGPEKVEIDVSNLASGLYFCTLRTDKKSSTKKLIIE